MNQNTKILAKLLSQENLDVVFSASANTAYFNTESRVLTLPKSMPEISEGLVLHEVGHALYTPAVVGPKMLRKYGALINVLEDARIEKKIKARYPGSINKFKQVYEVYEDKIRYGVVAEMKLIDRLNLSASSLIDHDYGFSDVEAVFCQRMMNTVTFEDVVQLSDDIKKHILDEREKEKDQQPEESPEQNDDEQPDTEEEQESGSSELGDEESDDEEEGESESGDDEEEGESSGQSELGEEEEDEDDEVDTDSDSGGKDSNVSPEDQDVEDDDEFKSDLQDLVDNELQAKIDENCDTTVIEVLLPAGSDIDVIVKTVDDYVKKYAKRTLITDFAQDGVAELRASISSTGTYMAAQFDRCKRADEMSRTSVSSSGSLNTRRLHLHNISDDIFNTIENLQQGKSHGVQLLVDYSGSMMKNLLSIIEQAALMIDFCQKANIPYEVYGFTSVASNTLRQREKMYANASTPDDQLLTTDCTYYKIASSTQSKAENELGVEIALRFGFYWSGRYYRGAHDFIDQISVQMGGTPTHQALVGMVNLTERFKLNNNVQVTNLIVFTDGGDGCGLLCSKDNMCKEAKSTRYPEVRSLTIIDTKTRKQYTRVTRDDSQVALFDILQTRLGINIIYIKMEDVSTLKWFISRNSNTRVADTDTLKKSPLVKLTDNSTVTTILMKPPKRDVSSMVKDNTVTKASFKKAMKGNKDARVFANLVVDEITANFV